MVPDAVEDLQEEVAAKGAAAVAGMNTLQNTNPGFHLKTPVIFQTLRFPRDRSSKVYICSYTLYEILHDIIDSTCSKEVNRKSMTGVVLVVTVMSIGVALIPLPAALLWVGFQDF